MMVLVENSMNFFLIISGQIGQSKKKEFEQTFRHGTQCKNRGLSCL